MIRKLYERFCFGFSAAVVVALALQLILSENGFSTVTPDFAARFRTEIAAVLAQMGMIGMIGGAFSMGSLIFELEKWSFLRQGAAHLLATAAVWIPVARLCWSPVQGNAVWYSIGGWAFTYVVVWLVQYLLMRRSVAKINRSLERRNADERR